MMGFLQSWIALGPLERITPTSDELRLALAEFGVVLMILAGGWLVATFAAWVLKSSLRAVRFNDGMRGLLGHGVFGTHEPSALAAWALRWLLLIVALVLAFDAVGLGVGAALTDRLRDLVPRILTAAILLVAGASLAMVLGALTRRFFDSAGLAGGKLRGQVVTVVLTFFSVLLALEQLGFAIQFIMALGLVVVAAAGIALALSFGLGCRDLAKDFLIEYLRTLDDDRSPRR